MRTDLGPSEWSDWSWWETGLLSPDDWTARWIEPVEEEIEFHHAPTTELAGNFDAMSHEFESAPFLGFGLGVQVNHWLRFEGTAEYRGNATFHGHDKYFNDLDGDGAPRIGKLLVDAQIDHTHACRRGECFG